MSDPPAHPVVRVPSPLRTDLTPRRSPHLSCTPPHSPPPHARATTTKPAIVYSWIEAKAELLKPKYAALMAKMQAHVDRYSELTSFKQLQRGLMGDQHGTYSGRRLSEVNAPGLGVTEVADDAQAWLLETMGMGDFKELTNTTNTADAGTYGDDDSTVAGSSCDVWMLNPPAWLSQCPDICVPFCCPRQGCCSGCSTRSSCTSAFLTNLSRAQTCYSCLTEGCELTSGSAPTTCVKFDSSEGAATSTGANSAPVVPRLRGADSGIMAFGPYNPRDSKPQSYQVLVSTIRMCRNLVCDGSQEGSNSITASDGEVISSMCVKGYVTMVPSQCLTLYSNPAYGNGDGQLAIDRSSARLSLDPGNGDNVDHSTGDRYALDSSSGCGQVRDAQAAGLYLDLADPGAGLNLGTGITVRASDAGSYTYVHIQLEGDYIVRAEVPLTSGAKLYTQPCGCEACPNSAAYSPTGIAQPNPDVICGGGGCSSCTMTPLSSFTAKSGAIKEELGSQMKMCQNDLREGPAAEVSVRQYAETGFFLSEGVWAP